MGGVSCKSCGWWGWGAHTLLILSGLDLPGALLLYAHAKDMISRRSSSLPVHIGSLQLLSTIQHTLLTMHRSNPRRGFIGNLPVVRSTQIQVRIDMEATACCLSTS
jgi:hypothetical protein